MLSAVKRYRLQLSGALARYFPRTTAYLHAEREAGLVEPPPARNSRKPGAASAKKPSAPRKKSAGTSKAAKQASPGIYGPAPLPIEAGQVRAMRERVAAAVAAGVISPPSEEQWAMILCRAPATRIFAGAGSGKSTTLVLRVVFMLCHLGVEPGRLTVISFTNASCAQLREQLLRVLEFWQYPFDAAMARQAVRTFHSAMAALAREVLDHPAWFEQLDDKAGGEPDNPLTSARLRPAQERLLKQAYQDCYDQDAQFRQRVHSLLGLPPPAADQHSTKAPLDGFKLAGEFTPAPLYEAFHAQAEFIESIGLRIDRLQPASLSCAAGERTFVEALMPFWRCFQASLQARGLMTFNGAFQRLTDSLAAGAPGLPAQALAPFQHLLIDEFQDISPQIVQWLQALHRALQRQKQAVSLMAIGDDWQSIYGWRGSSPELFMDFDRHFPGRGRSKHSTMLMLETNYRSIEPVIRDGEAVLAALEFKKAKRSQAFKAAHPGDHGVRLVSGFDLKARLPELIKEIEAQCRHAAARPSRERTAVLVLSRRNQPLQAIQAQLDRKLPVKAYTIHRAKGLQAEVAIIVDDCTPPEKHPLRNALYAQSGFFRNSYDQAMQDESLRLAYVAITRGVSRVLWFTRKPQGATELLARRAKG
ncbi:DEAD/DEAH box helicase [Pseudomonas benzenivorans]|uniref:DEAD/DEAH box helicase n=1 Tax=Pseudomonas benzenivorans TaxID=556533 RepID=A0ABY5H9R3_9PSED|nr:DEAD/DEAH box helicase [Pseudomonas benzenivorans]UTW09075.1 DEAD/DEAH box helicase [Pseudomonas benzenivorans]